jgi:adenine/guanine phosphoribosyltransferase-like PRPP-binding protein
MKKKIVKRKLATKKKSLPKKSEKIKHKIQSSYLSRVYKKDFLKVVPATVKLLEKFRKKNYFDAIAFTGSSGAALAFPLSYLMKLPLIHVRKGDGNHFGQPIEGTISSKNYIIVDDFIASGYTVRKIVKTIKKEYAHEANPVAIYLYNSSDRRKSLDDIPIISLPGGLV